MDILYKTPDDLNDFLERSGEVSEEDFLTGISLLNNYSVYLKQFELSDDLQPYLNDLDSFKEALSKISLENFGKDLTLDQTKYLISYSKDITKEFKVKSILWNDLWKVLKSSFNYSHLQWEDGYRLQDNFLSGGNLIVLDIDDNWSLNQAKEFLQSLRLKALIATTRHHQQQKDKLLPCDRFRIVLPTKTFIGTGREYAVMMANIVKFFENIPDIKAAKDCARFFYGNPNSEYWYLDGEAFDITQFSRVEHIERKQYQVPADNTVKSLIEWGIKNIHTGDRNSAFYWIFNRCIEKGINASLVINSINAQLVDPLPEHEIKLLLRQK